MSIDYDDPMMDDPSDEPPYRPEPRPGERTDARTEIRGLDRNRDHAPGRTQDQTPERTLNRDEDPGLRRREGKTLLDAIRHSGPKTLIPDMQAVQLSIDALREEMQRSNETLRAEMRESNEILRQEIKLRLDAIERLLTRSEPSKQQAPKPMMEKPATVDEVRSLLAVLEGRPLR